MFTRIIRHVETEKISIDGLFAPGKSELGVDETYDGFTGSTKDLVGVGPLELKVHAGAMTQIVEEGE